MAEIDKTALSYWFPQLEAAGLPVPRTCLITMPVAAQECVWSAFDGEDGKQPEAMKAFVGDIAAAGHSLGWPCFLRTDHTSGKHSWDKTCFLKSADDIPQHIFTIAEFSECCDMIGMPWSVWAVREFLPTKPHGTCPRYGNMPVCREFRFFADEGKVRCSHPYWPRHALEHGGWVGSDADFDLLCREPHELKDLAEEAGRAVGGSWSIDILETKRGWYVTDMAEAHKSFHWEGCDVVAKTPEVTNV